MLSSFRARRRCVASWMGAGAGAGAGALTCVQRTFGEKMKKILSAQISLNNREQPKPCVSQWQSHAGKAQRCKRISYK